MRLLRKKILILLKTLISLFTPIFIILAASSPLVAQFPADSDDVDWLIKVLELEEGSTVADVGAGDGDQTLKIAEYVGPEGKVFSTELESKLPDLREAVDESQLNNITVIKGDPNQTNLPEECCEAIFLRRVYHHFDDPTLMNNSLFKALKPGGRLGIIDFKPRESEANPEGRDQGDHHGVTQETVVQELKEAGFSLVSSEEPSGRNFYVVMEKPEE